MLDSPVISMMRFASFQSHASPLQHSGSFPPVSSLTISTTSRRRSSKAGSRGRISLVRQCTVKLSMMPRRRIWRTSACVSSRDGSRRILQLTLTCGGAALRMARSTSQRMSGVVRRCAPMPPMVEKGFGQPQFRSTPATSSCAVTNLIASYAQAALAEPSWKMTCLRSTGCVVKISFSSLTKDTRPVSSAAA
jgi:hypothetical protein